MYIDRVIGYIGKWINDILSRITVWIFPNQIPWVNGKVVAKLKGWTDAYNSGDFGEYRKSRSTLRREILTRLCLTTSTSTSTSTITDYKTKTSSAWIISAFLPDELNIFYARFESNSLAEEEQMCADPLKVWIHTRYLDLMASLAELFVWRLAGRYLHRCFQPVTTPVCSPHMPKTICLNDYHPLALTSTIMKCFERLVKTFITSSLPDSLDPLQFVSSPKRTTDDAISLTLHTALFRLNQRNTYCMWECCSLTIV